MPDDTSPAEDDDLLYLVEEDNKKYQRNRHQNLADLYRKARKQNLIQKQPHYA